jgi:hypothetical protein
VSDVENDVVEYQAGRYIELRLSSFRAVVRTGDKLGKPPRVYDSLVHVNVVVEVGTTSKRQIVHGARARGQGVVELRTEMDLADLSDILNSQRSLFTL